VCIYIYIYVLIYPNRERGGEREGGRVLPAACYKKINKER